MSAKRLVAALVAFAGATAFTACLLALVDGMRDVMQTDGPERRTAADRRLADRQPGGHGLRHRAQRIPDQHVAMTG